MHTRYVLEEPPHDWAAERAFAIEDRRRDRIIGCTRYHPSSAHRDAVEIGRTFLARDYWGTGYNGRVKRLLIERAFDYYAYVVLYGGAHNERSRRAIAKLGAEELTAADADGLWDPDPARFTYVLRRPHTTTSSDRAPSS